jgi:NACHT domain
MMASVRGRGVVGGAALVVVGCGLIAALALGPEGWLDVGDRLASVTGALLTAVGLVVTVRAARRGEPDSLDEVCAELARQVRARWLRESVARGLAGPEPLDLRWASTARAVAAAPAEVLGPMPGVRVTGLRLSGGVADLAVLWRRLPARQLVLLGPPGAGKTSMVILLVRRLLDDPRDGDPVPVPLSVADWNPERDLDTWFATKMAAEYPFLTEARRLVDSGRVLFVLDGLDELPAALRTDAVRGITAAVAGPRPLVLTCRTDEYEETVTELGTVLARAAVVELDPVTPRQAAGYLPAGQVDGTRRWAGVVAELADRPHGALATALSTPLTVYLARTAYLAADTEPAELLEFGDAVEDELFARYIPALYRDSELTPERARRGLSLLARITQADGTVAWWTLASRLRWPRRTVWALQAVLGVTIVAVLVGALGVGFVGTALVSLLAVALVPLAALSAMFTDPIFAVVLGSVTAKMLFTPLPVRLGGIAWIAGVLAACLGFATGFAEAFPRGFWPAVTQGLLVAVIAGVVVTVAGPAGRGGDLDPRRVLSLSRTATLTFAPVVGALAGVGAALASQPVVGVAIGVAVACGAVTQSAWGRYQIARALLAAGGHLPWRTAAFLDDAYQRGVLRQEGPQYHFRHLRLQEHLAQPE